MDPGWGSFFAVMSAFAGVVFAVVLAARHMTEREERTETHGQNEVRLWDSAAVTYELAAAAAFGAMMFVKGGLSARFFTPIVCLGGLSLSVRYLSAYFRLPRSDKGRSRKWAAYMTIFATAALLGGAVGHQMDLDADPLAHNLSTNIVAFSVSWLVFSGCGQALLWYISAWEKPRGDEAPDQPSQPIERQDPSTAATPSNAATRARPITQAGIAILAIAALPLILRALHRRL